MAHSVETGRLTGHRTEAIGKHIKVREASARRKALVYFVRHAVEQGKDDWSSEKKPGRMLSRRIVV